MLYLFYTPTPIELIHQLHARAIAWNSDLDYSQFAGRVLPGILMPDRFEHCIVLKK
jgi:hypothetical protein